VKCEHLCIPVALDPHRRPRGELVLVRTGSLRRPSSRREALRETPASPRGAPEVHREDLRREAPHRPDDAPPAGALILVGRSSLTDRIRASRSLGKTKDLREEASSPGRPERLVLPERHPPTTHALRRGRAPPSARRPLVLRRDRRVVPKMGPCRRPHARLQRPDFPVRTFWSTPRRMPRVRGVEDPQQDEPTATDEA